MFVDADDFITKDCASLLVDEINKKSIDTCVCGFTSKNPEIFMHKRIIKGFKTSYRRMKWDLPASTITMNSGVISSDMKGHPEQNRVLSIKQQRHIVESLDEAGTLNEAKLLFESLYFLLEKECFQSKSAFYDSI